MNGTSFARKLLFIKYVDEYHEECNADDPYHGPATSWVSSCPDDVEPRSLDNPNTYSWEETFEDGWHEQAPRNQWYVVGAQDDWYWYGIDIDGDDDHETTVDFEKEDLRFPSNGALLALSKSGWPHQYTLHKGEPPAIQAAVDGVDILSDVEAANYRGAVSPWHDDRREVRNDPVVTDKTEQLSDALNGDGHFTSAVVDGEKVELIERKEIGGTSRVDVKLPDDAPDELYECEQRLLEVRSSDARYEYGESPFQVDTHAALIMLHNGRSVEEATAWFAEYPPAKAEGFDKEETEYQLKELATKVSDGDLHPPRKKLGVDVSNCDCAIHGEEQRNWQTRLELPDDDGLQLEPDEALKWEIRREYADRFDEVIGTEHCGHMVGPKGCGKTYNSVRAAQEDDVKVFLAAPTKQKYREICELAEEMGVRALRLPSFPEHSPLYSDWENEYHRGALPRELYTWDDRDPEMMVDEYMRRQGLDFEQFDLLVGAPVHAFIESVVEDRIVVFDDAELTAFRDPLDRATKDQINHVLEEVENAPDSWKGLPETRWPVVEAAIARELSAVDVSASNDLWDALEERTAEDNGIDRRSFLAQLPGASLEVIDWMRALTGHLHTSDSYEDRGMRLVTAEDQRVLVRAPSLTGAQQVFTMGAVPAEEQLEAAFDDMGVEYEGLFGSARHGDMERACGRINMVAKDAINSSSGEATDPELVDAVMDGVRRLGFDEEPVYFGTKKDVDAYGSGRNYASLVGTNEYAAMNLAVLGGSQHYGDEYVKREAAFAGAEPEDPEQDGPFEPREWDDGIHDAVAGRMRASGATEAATRVGRNSPETTVIVRLNNRAEDWQQTVDVSGQLGKMAQSRVDLYEYVKETDELGFIKDGEGGGAVRELPYSAPTLYAAADELVEEGWLVVHGSPGAYNANGYEVEAEEEPVNRPVKGLNTAGLTSSAISSARNPDWEIVRPDGSDVERGSATTGLENVT